MLTSKTVSEGVVSILEALSHSHLDEARRKIDAVNLEVKTEKDRGILMAARGIATSMSKDKDGTLQTWDQAKIGRAARAITQSQMSDDFDIGYSETLLEYAKLIAPKS